MAHSDYDDMQAEEPVARERRAPDPGRRSADRSARLRSAAATVLALCGALSVVYFAVAAVGAVDLADAALASGIALGLALLWLIGVWQRTRSNAGFVTRPDRERRGF